MASLSTASRIRSISFVEHSKSTGMFCEQVLSSSSSEETPEEDWSSLILEIEQCAVSRKAIHDKMTSELDGFGNEVCLAEDVPSYSTIQRHEYYKYPCVKDPGIEEALFSPAPIKTYDSDGRELYLEVCEETNTPFIRIFYRGLLENTIDMQYYCVPSKSVRSMCLALENNVIVKRLDLTSNFLDAHACYHLGYLLSKNTTLKEIILSQCRIGPNGLHKLVMGFESVSLDLLDLSKNELSDEGISFLAIKLRDGAIISKLNLSYNDLGSNAMTTLATEFESLGYYNPISHLDLSWNKLWDTKVVGKLVKSFEESNVLEDLNLAWTGCSGAPALASLLLIPTLKKLDLSNNRLTSATVKAIANNLPQAEGLRVLNLSFNPLTPEDAFALIVQMNLENVNLQTLLLDAIPVSHKFIDELEIVLSTKKDQNLCITHGKLLSKAVVHLADMRSIILKRLHILSCRGHHKYKFDIAVYFLDKYKTRTVMSPDEMLGDMKAMKSVIDTNIVEELSRYFPGPRISKEAVAIDLEKVVDFVARLWPDAKPTPPPPPAEIVIKKNKQGKGAKKTKGLKKK